MIPKEPEGCRGLGTEPGQRAGLSGCSRVRGALGDLLRGPRGRGAETLRKGRASSALEKSQLKCKQAAPRSRERRNQTVRSPRASGTCFQVPQLGGPSTGTVVTESLEGVPEQWQDCGPTRHPRGWFPKGKALKRTPSSGSWASLATVGKNMTRSAAAPAVQGWPPARLLRVSGPRSPQEGLQPTPRTRGAR